MDSSAMAASWPAARRRRSVATIALLTMEPAEPGDYGRGPRGGADRICAIVEARDAAPAQLGIREVNVGTYVFDAAWLRAELSQLTPSPGGEIYLTDLVARAAASGAHVAGLRLADPREGLGVNDRV